MLAADPVSLINRVNAARAQIITAANGAVFEVTDPTPGQQIKRVFSFKNVLIGGAVGVAGVLAYLLLVPSKKKPATAIAGLFRRRRH